MDTSILHTTSAVSIKLRVPVSTLLALEARGAVGRWRRDNTGRRLLSDDDIEQVRRYLEGHRREQGPEPLEPRSSDPEDIEGAA